MERRKTGLVSLTSESLRFETEWLVGGAEAAAALQRLRSPDESPPTPLAPPLHVGAMSVNCQAVLTPPPTPSSVVLDEDEPTGGPEDMDTAEHHLTLR